MQWKPSTSTQSGQTKDPLVAQVSTNRRLSGCLPSRGWARLSGFHVYHEDIWVVARLPEFTSLETPNFGYCWWLKVRSKPSSSVSWCSATSSGKPNLWNLKQERSLSQESTDRRECCTSSCLAAASMHIICWIVWMSQDFRKVARKSLAKED